MQTLIDPAVVFEVQDGVWEKKLENLWPGMRR